MALDDLMDQLPDDELLKLDNKLCFMLYACSRAMTKQYRPYLEPLGLTYPQYLVMVVLWENQAVSEGLRVAELGEKLHLDSGTLTPLLKRLETAELVIRKRGVQDEREVFVNLTKKGNGLRSQAADVSRQLLCTSGVSVEQVKQARGLLEKLLVKIEGA